MHNDNLKHYSALSIILNLENGACFDIHWARLVYTIITLFDNLLLHSFATVFLTLSHTLRVLSQDTDVSNDSATTLYSKARS